MRQTDWTLPKPRSVPPLLIPALLAGGAVVAAGFWAGAAAGLILSIPILGALAARVATRRGLIVATILLIFGLSQVDVSTSAIAWGDLLIVAILMGTGLVMGRRIEAEAPKTAALESDRGLWMTITVEAGCPPASAGILSPIPVPPLDDPERRSLYRRKNGRRSMAMAGSD